MSEDAYNGWKNRETWALCLHLGNDQGLYEWSKEYAREARADYSQKMTEFDLEESDAGRTASVGRYIIEQAQELIAEWPETTGEPMPSDHPLALMREDVGSWWRVDESEVGAWALELVEDES